MTLIIYDVIKGVDALNMAFSLVLSALLEQMWSRGKDSNLLYKITLGAEGFLVLLGGMVFIAYSILKEIQPQNQLFSIAFGVNLIYIIGSTITVILGFWSRTLKEEK